MHCIPHTAEAKAKIAAGNIRAHKGRPCPWRRRPSVVKNGVTLWRCRICVNFYPKSFFGPNKRTILGIQSECRTCQNAYSIRARDPQKHREEKIRSEGRRRARAFNANGFVSRLEMEELKQKFGAFCLKCETTKSLEWDHVIPLARGGRHCVSNLQRLCQKCNGAKHTSIADYRSDAQRLWTIQFSKI